MRAFLRDLRNKDVDGCEARLREVQRAGELPAQAGPRARADYFATVLQGLSQRAQDGATAPRTDRGGRTGAGLAAAQR
ncbi:hypothetical protein [Streptomyces reniochalinae]|uniref:Uncharacterized protein n=1 Tax=Streptomyces reniochalinae TaxID=2250578 RepID=A0A367EMX6_9ACTN|nr:hypothetical protein [Streptomyces reniochalinae]RCG18737.1 hypothetical protein DQ392_12480 [Streptomyces reniochalinae]